MSMKDANSIKVAYTHVETNTVSIANISTHIREHTSTIANPMWVSISPKPFSTVALLNLVCRTVEHVK